MDAGSDAGSKVTYFEGLVESSPDGIVVVSDGRIVLVNRQTEVLFGYTREELLGEPVELLVQRARRAAGARARPRGAPVPPHVLSR